MGSALQIAFVFTDEEDRVCSVLVDSYGFARFCIVPSNVDARIAERVDAAIALGELAEDAGDRERVCQIQVEQTELLESAATMQDEWSFTLFLPSDLSGLIWLNREFLQRRQELDSSEQGQFQALLDRIHLQLARLAEKSPLHPKHSPALPA